MFGLQNIYVKSFQFLFFSLVSYGSSDNTRGGLVMSRYFNPYYNPRSVGGGMAAFMFKQPEAPVQPAQAPSHYIQPERRPPAQDDYYPQQNEVYYHPQAPEKPIVTEATDLAEPTEKTEFVSTTARAVTTVPELVEPEVEEVEEPVQKPKKRVSKRKQVKKPVEDEEEDDDYQPKMPANAFFPMFFGWGGRAAHGGGPGGATAVANAYSTGRGGVATSHAIAYGVPKPEYKLQP